MILLSFVSRSDDDFLRYALALFPASDLLDCAKHLFLKDVTRRLHGDGAVAQAAREARPTALTWWSSGQRRALRSRSQSRDPRRRWIRHFQERMPYGLFVPDEA